MIKVPALWSSTARKEVMDLLEITWKHLDEAGRNRLSRAIIDGPPANLLESIEESERSISRDRRIFDRIVILERCEHPPLTPALRAEIDRLRGYYPNWSAPEGESAHFNTWMEFEWRRETEFSEDRLATLDERALTSLLVSGLEHREEMIDAWGRFAHANPERALVLLEALSNETDCGPPDVWTHGLWGLRDSLGNQIIRERVLAILADVSDEYIAQQGILQAIADTLQSASRYVVGRPDENLYWRVFDRAIDPAGRDTQNLNRETEREPGRIGRSEWVFFALNCSMGQLASALLDVLFARKPAVGAGIPPDLKERFSRLMGDRRMEHLPARVVAASRIAYLFAIDSEWCQFLLAQFCWEDEEESIALWQGYAWQARIDAQLWRVLKPGFLPLFTSNRLNRLGDMRRNIAHLLMLVGIEFGPNELPRDDTRQAIREMLPDMRIQAIAWVANYLEQLGAVDSETRRGIDPAGLWRDRVAPWLKSVWPPEPTLRSASLSEQFALAAIASEDAFGEAVRMILPYVIPANGFEVLRKLDVSTHPEGHPNATLQLLDAVVAPDAPRLLDRHLSRILDRIAAWECAETDYRYIRWRERVGRAP